MGSLMYTDNVVDSLDYRIKHNVRRIPLQDLDILGHGLKQYVERYKILFAYDEKDEKVLNELEKISELLINHQYDKLIEDPLYMIDPHKRKNDY